MRKIHGVVAAPITACLLLATVGCSNTGASPSSKQDGTASASATAPAVGIAAQTTKAAQTDTAPVLRTQAPFPGIWDITTWTQYRAMQAAFLQGGHQPWLLHPSMVVSAWAASLGWQPTPAVHQVSPNVFQVVKPGTTIAYTVQGTCPDPESSAPIWVITSISHS